MKGPASSVMPALSTRGLVAGRASHELKIEDFDLFPGETVAIVGPSGVGKTTLLRTLAGLEQPLDGEVVVAKEADGSAGRVGISDQRFTLFGHLTVRDNVVLAAKIQARGKRCDVDAALRLCKVERFEGKRPWELSGGMRARASLAQALVVMPRVLLLDEPFSGLDQSVRDEICEDIKQVVAATQTATLIVSHELTSCCDLTSRILILGCRQGAPGDRTFCGGTSELLFAGEEATLHRVERLKASLGGRQDV